MNAPCIVRYTLWHYINQRVTVDGRHIQLSSFENKLFFILYVNMGRPIALTDIVESLWHDADGGPLWAEDIVSRLCWKLRCKTGLSIFGTYGKSFCCHKKSVVLSEPETAIAEAA